ncbi:hypothetical protein Pan258_02310 [Symmachiella dynata]|uniref:hypothetical protein n=1 Tax=Symmachiella dynata TaxID=2527995 RepID=UPI00118A2E35|nr:hypothetical protein [Symmachiella dynata]QDT46214.1 hypothetical protein Pan258_02310 [Symmachiella dynata]
MNDREKIIGVLREYADRETCYEMEELADAILAAITPSFSKAVIENNEIVQRCDLGFRHVTRPYHWRSLFVPVLRIVRQAERAMTTAELKRHFPPKEQATAAKCLSELCHFNAVRIAGKRAGERLYRVTNEGGAFLDGVGELPEFAYPKDAILPPDAPKPKMIRAGHQFISLSHVK